MADGKASQDIRAQAKYWAELYREAQRTPARVVRDPVTGFAVQADDTEFLITLLENFAERGTFAFKPELGLSEMVMALRFSLINNDKNLGAREAELAQNLGISPSNVKRPLSNVKNRLKDLRKSKSVNRILENAWGVKHKK
jgi:hypothetical protein